MSGAGTERDMVTVSEAARELNLSGRAVLHRIERGELQAERISSRLYLIPRAEVERHKAIGRLRPGRKPRDRAES